MRLERLLNELIEKYGNNKGYPTPTISWSEENMMSRYGEYNYHTNHITISRLLDTEEVSDKYLSCVIFHELTHQIVFEHNDKFFKNMDRIDAPKDLENVLNEHMNSCKILPAKKQPVQLDFGETLFIKLKHKKDEPYSWFDNILRFEHDFLVIFKSGVPKELSNKTMHQVIFVLEEDGIYYSLGWAKNVKICKHHCYVDYSDLGFLDFCFDCLFKPSDKYFVAPCNSICIGNKTEFDNSLSTKGYLFSDGVDNQILEEIINLINIFDYEEESLGYTDEAIKIESCIEATASELPSIIDEETNAFRKLLLLNKLVSLAPSYDSYIARAEIFTSMDYYDCAIEDYKKAKLYSLENSKLIDELIKKNQVALDRYINAVEL